MKKNFFATLIIAALIVVMSFTLASCDFFNRGNSGSGSNGGNSNSGNGGDDGNDGGSVLNGLDASKLSAEAKADKDAQKLALMIDDELFEIADIITREDIAVVLAECMKDNPGDDPYRAYSLDPNVVGNGVDDYRQIVANNELYNILKEANIKIQEVYENTDYYFGESEISDDLNRCQYMLAMCGIRIAKSSEEKQDIEEIKQGLFNDVSSWHEDNNTYWWDFTETYEVEGMSAIVIAERENEVDIGVFYQDKMIRMNWMLG